MALITSRAELIEYSLRKLGKPVINIEVDMDQVSDRVDEALQFFQDFHYDGTERIYLKHQITGTRINVADGTGFSLKEEVVAQTSGLKFTAGQVGSTFVMTAGSYKNGVQSDAFTVGETLIGQVSGFTTTYVSKVNGDIENRYITTPELVSAVIRVIPFRNFFSGDNYVFDPQYQFILNNFHNLASTSIIEYTQLQQHISLLDMQLRPIDSIRFNRHQNRIHIDTDWKAFSVGEYILFEAYRILDPEVFIDIYNDRMLKKLVTAKIKYQWGQNVSKYNNIQLLGGITIDGSRIMAEATAEIEAAETEIRDSYEELAIGFVG